MSTPKLKPLQLKKRKPSAALRKPARRVWPAQDQSWSVRQGEQMSWFAPHMLRNIMAY